MFCGSPEGARPQLQDDITYCSSYEAAPRPVQSPHTDTNHKEGQPYEADSLQRKLSFKQVDNARHHHWQRRANPCIGNDQ